MKSLEEAVKRAQIVAKKKQMEQYVVFSPHEMDVPGNDYHVADEIDADTFFQGCRILAVCSPSGDIEYSNEGR